MGGAAADRLRPLLQPTSVALVGASARNPFTRPMLRSLTTLGYRGRVTLVHKDGVEIDGVPCVGSLSALPQAPEAVAVLVGTDASTAAVREAAELGTKAAVVYSGGFADAGPEGARRQRELSAIAASADLALLGPNCQGFLNVPGCSGLYLQELTAGDPRATAGLISQSGSVADALVNNRQGVRWSHVIATGNEARVDATDVLEYLIDATECRVICLFLEAIRRPEEFFAQCDRALRADKPVILLKSGRSAAGSLAAEAHTGALAQPDRLVDALLRRHGVTRVASLEEMLATVVLLAAGRRAVGRRVALVTGSGGMNELFLDELDDVALDLPALSAATVTALEPVYGPGRVSNPLDYWPPLVPLDEALKRSFETIARDPDIDVLALQSAFSMGTTGPELAGLGSPEFLAAAADSTKPFVIVDTIPGGVPANAIEHARASNVAIVSGIRASLRAIGHLADRGAERAPLVDAVASDVPDLDAELTRLSAHGAMSGAAALELLRSAGMPVPEVRTTGSVEATVDVAARLGFPVVVKDDDPKLLHKTESGGLALNLKTPSEVAQAAGAMWARGSRRFLVQRYFEADHELLLGLQSHDQLGTFIVVGLGGTWTEIIDDVAIRPVGLRCGEAVEMLDALRGAALLRGARGRPPVAFDAVAAVIETLDRFAQRFGRRLRSLDLNPVLVKEAAAFCVDAVIVPRQDCEEPAERSRDRPETVARRLVP